MPLLIPDTHPQHDHEGLDALFLFDVHFLAELCEHDALPDLLAEHEPTPCAYEPDAVFWFFTRWRPDAAAWNRLHRSIDFVEACVENPATEGSSMAFPRSLVQYVDDEQRTAAFELIDPASFTYTQGGQVNRFARMSTTYLYTRTG